MDGLRLRRAGSLPDGLLDAEPEELEGILGGPTLFDLPGPGGSGGPVFVSALLHGNETSGWLAAREFLRAVGGGLPAPLALLVGNPEAARLNARFVPGEPDRNRIWSAKSGTALGRDLWAMCQELGERGVAVALDIHNNNAPNPCHAIHMVRECDVDARDWAMGFAGLAVRTTLSQFTCMEAFAGLCPSVTLECGEPGEREGIELAVDCLTKALFAGRPPRREGGQEYELVARILPRDGVTIGFGGEDADLSLPADAPEKRNFRLTEKGAEIGKVKEGVADPLVCVSPEGRGLGEFLAVEGGRLVAAADLVLAMLVARRDTVEDDCLCYVLEPALDLAPAQLSANLLR